MTTATAAAVATEMSGQRTLFFFSSSGQHAVKEVAAAVLVLVPMLVPVLALSQPQQT